MMRVLTGAAAWLAGTALAVGLAWFGAGMVVRNTAATPGVPAVTAAPGGVPASAGVPAAPAVSPGTASPTTGDATRRAATGREPSVREPAVRETTGREPTGRATAPADELRSYTLTGGRVTLDMTTDSATLVTAVPSSGYSVQKWSATGWLRVDFNSGARVSSLIATWNGHPPSVTVTN